MLRRILFLFLIIAFSCDKTKPVAQGGDNEIVLICSKFDKPQIESILSYILTDTLFTPQAEPYYKLIWVEPERFNDVKNYVNVIVAGIGSSPSNNGAILIKNILSEDQYSSSMYGDNHIIFSKDIFARDQNFLIINGPSVTKIKELSIDQGPWLKKQFDLLFEKRQSQFLFDESTLQKELEDEVFSKYGWSIKIPWGYTVIRDSAEQQIFWIGRDLPFRWLAVQWEKGLLFSDSSSVSNYANQFPVKFFKNIRYTDYKYKVEPSMFNDYGSWKISGLWESIEEAQGGPFISHLFYDEKKDRTYFVHSMIFHPGRNKFLLLKQVDIVAKTFYTEMVME
ncbi:MAG: DUF4837 family protein [Candidatus Neomarinimicrobiota bacterium]|nr:MAG: hypothetical protein CBC68_04300 [Candidatus Marinimicrobia bacterium TMED108]